MYIVETFQDLDSADFGLKVAISELKPGDG
jgi:hypothetical protein